MKKIKSVLCIMFAVLIMLCGVAGCNGKKTDSGDNGGDDEDETPFIPVNDWPASQAADDSFFTHPKLTWSDEFNGNTLNTDNWNFDIGTGSNGWGNAEKQYYREENTRVNGGKLQIIARYEQFGGSIYTSSRLTTKGKFSQKYGKFEARIKVPAGQGIWPAFWMMPSDSVYGTWPRSGEIDIMEMKGRLENNCSSAIHYGTSHIYQTKTYTYPNGGRIDEFHTYAVQWTENSIKFSVDDVVYFTTFNNWSAPGGTENSPFDQEFYLIINMAIGGNFDNKLEPSLSAFAPAVMEVDYVRVYSL